MSAPTVLSLFAGIGGLDLGLHSHGCVTTAYSEVNPYASKVMAHRFPQADNLGDITKIDWDSVSDNRTFDIICGGFPCQDISLTGQGGGVSDGERSGLWRHYADAIRTLRPRGVLVENVAALLTRGIDIVLGDLAACGYDAEWDCVPAAAVGAPHLRDRIFIVAYPVAHADGAPPQGGGVPSGMGSEHAHVDDTGGDIARSWPRPLRATSWDDAEPTPGGRFAPPDVCRMADGIPARVDRLRCLGNAVVPSVAEHAASILLNRMAVNT